MPYTLSLYLYAAKTYMRARNQRNLREASRSERASPLRRTPGHGVNDPCRDGGYDVMIAGGFVGVAQGGEGNSVVAATWLIELRIL